MVSKQHLWRTGSLYSEPLNAFIHNLITSSIGNQVFLHSLESLSSSPSFLEAASSQAPQLANDTNPFDPEFVHYYGNMVPAIQGHLLGGGVTHGSAQTPDELRGQDLAMPQGTDSLQSSQNLNRTEPLGGTAHLVQGLERYRLITKGYPHLGSCFPDQLLLI